MEDSVCRHDGQSACHGLSDDQPIPGIAMRTGKLPGGDGVVETQLLGSNSCIAQRARQVGRNLRRQFPEPLLVGDLIAADDACKNRVARLGNCASRCLR